MVVGDGPQNVALQQKYPRADVHGLRFHLVDGTIWERSHVFFGPGALFVDGNGTALGVARYSSMGTLPLDGSTRVDVSEAPPVRRAA